MLNFTVKWENVDRFGRGTPSHYSRIPATNLEKIMTIKQLIEQHGGVGGFHRMLKDRKKLYTEIDVPHKKTLYNHIKGVKYLTLKMRDLYKELGVTDF